jgi:pimeloyl-ACP methyl ester carboxylesterase
MTHRKAKVHRPWTWWAGIVVGLVVVLIAGALAWREFAPTGDEPEASASPTPSLEPSDAPDPSVTTPPNPALAEFYDQSLDWTPCREEFQCASLAVPLDYRDPAGERIEIALLKVPAARVSRGALIVNPGGPGAPGTAYAEAAERVFRSPLLDNFDIVGFDPRGTGDSAPVDCLSDTELDDYVSGDPDPDTAAEVATFVASAELLGKRCAARSGKLAEHVSTLEAAQDIDVLRAALGESQLTYFGASYGTQLGATYAELFPDRVGRLVLDGAIDLSLSGPDLGKQQAAGFELALRAYIQNCVMESSSCFLGTTVDAGVTRIQQFLAEVEADPLSTELEGRRLEVGNAFYGLVAPLYQREAWAALSLALRAAFSGDGTTLLQFSDLYTSREADGYSDNSIEANITISCLDSPEFTDPDSVPETYQAYAEASPTFGRVFAWSQIGCNGFPAEPVLPPRAVRASGADPILVVGTTRDPATPMRWAEALASQLESGVLLRRDGDGHTAYNSGNECIDDTIEAYLLDGTVPADGFTC